MKLNQNTETGIWHSALPFKSSDLQDAKVDITFSDGKTLDARLHVEAHDTDPSLHALVVVIDGFMLAGSHSGRARQLIALRAPELSALDAPRSSEPMSRFRLSLDASRLSEALPIPL